VNPRGGKGRSQSAEKGNLDQSIAKDFPSGKYADGFDGIAMRFHGFSRLNLLANAPI
jgi:hypothetical protein